MAPPPGLSSCAALTDYAGAGRQIVAGLKYRNSRSSVPWLAGELARKAPEEGADVVTWLPTTASRRRRRGFDQSELLARALARRLCLPCRSMLRRLPGPPQTGQSRQERLVGPLLELRRTARVAATVLLIDDVVTTGASLAVASRRLREAGAREVHALVIARRR